MRGRGRSGLKGAIEGMYVCMDGCDDMECMVGQNHYGLGLYEGALFGVRYLECGKSPVQLCQIKACR